MTEPTALFLLAGMAVYPYGVCVAAAALLGALLLCAVCRGRLGNAQHGLRLMLYALPLGLLFARLGYLAVRWRFLMVDYVPGFWAQLSLGGYSLAGGSLGVVLAVWLYGRISGQGFAGLLDAAAPAALVFLAGMRLAERFTLDGVGGYVDAENLWFFPVAVQNPYGEYVFPVFFWEALTALLLCGGLLWWMRKPARRKGDAALTGMLWLGLTQIFWESLRTDDYLRFGFVRVNQLWGLLLAVIAVSVWLARSNPSRARVAVTAGAMALCALALVGVEFGLDKSTLPNALLYGVMIVSLGGMALMGGKLRNACERGAIPVARS